MFFNCLPNPVKNPVLASDRMFPMEYKIANFLGTVQKTLDNAEHAKPNAAQKANPYMRCSKVMFAHDVYSSRTSTGVSGALGSIPALRARERALVSPLRASRERRQRARPTIDPSSASRHIHIFRVVVSRASPRVDEDAHQADFIDPFLHHARHRASSDAGEE